MGNVTTIGLDIAKKVFQVHGVDADGAAVVRQRPTRRRMLKFFAKLPRCLIGIEACATSHFWARVPVALGHDVKLMPAQYVKPYVKRAKGDAADAEAIREAVTPATMRFVGIMSPEQQSAMMLHRVRLFLNRQRTLLPNAMRAHPAEFGIAAPIGRTGIERLIDVIADPTEERVPADARFCLEMLAAQLRIVKEQILENDRRILASAHETELGPLLPSAIVATVPDPAILRLAATWLPGSAWYHGRTRVAARSGSAVSPRPGQYIRQMLIVGAMAVVRYAEQNGTKRPCLVQLLARRKAKVAAVALANKNARMIWAMMASGERYREPQVV